MERLTVPHAGAWSALASGRGSDRVLTARENQAGFFAGFFVLRGRVLPCDPLKTLPRNVRLSPLPKAPCSRSEINLYCTFAFAGLGYALGIILSISANQCPPRSSLTSPSCLRAHWPRSRRSSRVR